MLSRGACKARRLVHSKPRPNPFRPESIFSGSATELLDTAAATTTFFEYIHRYVPAVGIKLYPSFMEIASKDRAAEIMTDGLEQQPAWPALSKLLQDAKILKVLESKTWPCLAEPVNANTALVLSDLDRLINPKDSFERAARQDTAAQVPQDAASILAHFNKLDALRYQRCPDQDLPIKTVQLTPVATTKQAREVEFWLDGVATLQTTLRQQRTEATQARQRLTEQLKEAEARQLAVLAASRVNRTPAFPPPKSK